MIEFLTKLVHLVFVYCTDFMINLGNLLGLSYYEVNALFFCLLWPLITIILFLLYGIQRYRLKRWKHKHLLKSRS
jgi:hypothetical protein